MPAKKRLAQKIVTVDSYGYLPSAPGDLGAEKDRVARSDHIVLLRQPSVNHEKEVATLLAALGEIRLQRRVQLAQIVQEGCGRYGCRGWQPDFPASRYIAKRRV